MAPFIRDGDVITVAPLQQTLPKLGEVVAFTRPESGKLVVHRVVAIHTNAVSIQGDNGLDYVDGVIPQTNLLGRVTRIERNKRKVWIGLGPERYVVAWLSRTFLLIPIRSWFAAVSKPFSRRCK